MKNFLYLSFLVAIFLSCSNNSEISSTDTNLISPKGVILAKSSSELIQLLYDQGTIKSKSNIEIEDIRFFETNDYSIAAIDFYEANKFSSSLYFIDIDDNYTMLKDKKSITLVKGTTHLTNIKNSKNTITFSSSQTLRGGTAECKGGDCCKWEQTGENKFNCGCPATDLDDGPVITTSEGCEVEIND